jgi:hypothetical protein
MNNEFDDEQELDEDYDPEYADWEGTFDEDLNDISNVQPVSVTNILQKTNRLLSENEKIVVQNGNVSGSIAQINIKTRIITLDIEGTTRLLEQAKKNSMFNFVTLTKAVNYHELAHFSFADYSPTQIKDKVYEKYKEYCNAPNTKAPMTASYKKWKIKFKKHLYIDGSSLKQYLNILEDLRIEKLFSTQYPRAKFYFSFSLAMLNSPKKMDIERMNSETLLSLYALWYGRRYLFDESSAMIDNLKKIAQQSIPKKVIKMTEEIIDSFIVEVDADERVEIAYFLALVGRFLSQIKQQESNRGNDCSSSNDDDIETGRKRSSKNLQELIGEMKLSDEEEEGQEDGQGKKASGKGKGNKNEQNLDEEKETEDNSVEEDTEENIKTRQEKRQKQESLANQIQELIDKFTDSIEDKLQSDESFKKEVDRNIQEITGKSSIDETGVPFKFGAEEQFETGRIEQLLRKLRGDLSASYQRYESRGKIDVPSFIRAKHNQDLKMFARRTINKMSLARLGVSFIIDSSGSVNDNDFSQEMKAVYCFSKALEKLQNKVEVIEFSSEYRILKGFNQTGDWKRSYRDNTRASRPMAKSIANLEQIKSNERINNRYIILVSDGYFNDSSAVVDTIKKAHSFGIKVIWILVGNGGGNNKIKNDFDEFICIEKFTDLSQKMQSLINRMQREVIRNIERGSF